ncbi:hypothetical protein QWT69_00380 [Sporosarcina oncorhynchi]|uniref:Uncharacterized protein n=1 Tax=Sporosarcina oncorhynchi TaxID=3056444 RepID=A0ABZ0L556_9BACL|nr:hypothetical protein [Sporosarcina sp. T2O-4]WOV87630.1 hypothetical protein QWT69_00380 [Sporosarcina sp. T2O-4]
MCKIKKLLAALFVTMFSAVLLSSVGYAQESIPEEDKPSINVYDGEGNLLKSYNEFEM